MSRLARAALAALSLAALGGGLVLPVAALVLDEARPAFCCTRGRCCCADGEAGTDERPCLRRGCGCEQGAAIVAGALLSFEAVLPASSRPASPGPAAGPERPPALRPHAEPHAPPVPPPRRHLPA